MSNDQKQSSDYKDAPAPAKSAAPLSLGMRVLLFLLILAVYAAHQDLWNWSKPEPMVFGFLPAGLAYQAAYSIACSVLMAVMVKTAWPKQLEDTEDSSK